MGDSSTCSRGREIAADHEVSKAITTYLTYENPCYYLEVAVRAFLKCLGLNNSDPSSSSSSSASSSSSEDKEEEERNQTSTTQLDDPPSPTTTKTETEKKATEDGDIVEVTSMRRRPNIQKPTKPPVGTGRPGQHN